MGAESGRPRPHHVKPRPSLFVLGLAAGIGPFTVDSYLPGMPRIAADLHSADAPVQLTLAATMLGFAIGQLVIGPWSDRVGRRIPLVSGLVLLLLTSVAAVLATDVVHLLIARFFQGVGAAATIVVAVALTRDRHTGAELARALGAIAIVQSLAPLIAPVIGSLQLGFIGWRGIFASVAAYALVVLVLIVVQVPRGGNVLGAGDKLRTRYRRLFRDRLLITLLALAALRFIALYTFLQWSPFLFQGERESSPIAFGIMFAIMTLGMMLGLQITPRAIRRGVPPSRVLWTSYIVLAIGAALVAVPIASAAWMVLAGVVFMLGCGLGLPTIQVLALLNHERDAATVAGLIGAAGFGIAALVAPAINLLPPVLGRYDLSLAVVIGTVALASVAVSARGLASIRSHRL